VVSLVDRVAASRVVIAAGRVRGETDPRTLASSTEHASASIRDTLDSISTRAKSVCRARRARSTPRATSAPCIDTTSDARSTLSSSARDAAPRNVKRPAHIVREVAELVTARTPTTSRALGSGDSSRDGARVLL
jgi:hypothetical protein